MAGQYHWRVNLHPRYTVLEFGEYMAADDGPRETILRDMKYERIARTLSYRDLYACVAAFLSSPNRDYSILGEFRQLLNNAEINAAFPQQRENVRHQIRALEAFGKSLNALPLGGIMMTKSPISRRWLDIEGVRIHVQPTVDIRIRKPKLPHRIGAIVVDLAKGNIPKTEAAEIKLTESMVHSAVLLHEFVSVIENDELKADPEHCVIFHAHRSERVCAPKNHKNKMKNIKAVCRGIARSWEHAEPPSAFDESNAVYRR